VNDLKKKKSNSQIKTANLTRTRSISFPFGAKHSKSSKNYHSTENADTPQPYNLCTYYYKAPQITQGYTVASNM
jgi:hypothetical protein